MRGAAAGIRIGDDDPQAALGGPPADGKADDPAADDQDVGVGNIGAAVSVLAISVLALFTNPCAPFAGMTRIRFCGRRLLSRPLSPVGTGLPRV